MKKEAFLEINEEQFKAFVKFPKDTSVVMLNLLKFKELVTETGLSGADSYKEYMKKATPFFIKAEAEILFMGKETTMLIGPEDEELWDKILLIKYKTISDFLEMIQAEGYPSHLRNQALEDSRLIHCS
ncbi:DUF1330 domain-containing protein [Maribacter sp. 1_MG-2023]|uniref:DUF1330 domain-containing protein n=1 Tax=Maribacter sp. 1_MG-2023 TaxID=3062677 RepID=UPI0026E27202|nr:DUF1330 domain-containing protein [Maribacter sp. 1_MG-2023]MDO6472650.1 DUF1330 domain-containing protein [Maribacter sp. 1_MG-2023]